MEVRNDVIFEINHSYLSHYLAGGELKQHNLIDSMTLVKSNFFPYPFVKTKLSCYLCCFHNSFTDYSNEHLFNDLDMILWHINCGISNLVVY